MGQINQDSLCHYRILFWLQRYEEFSIPRALQGHFNIKRW
ncbi:hypothetical protein HMPREF9136_1284 [Prevotella dentalis DSM 3688]|uniref:Uncharacterized protein n=1 Tax=Prevotella dentalis (strain ATCC 49559 / DSM 3688 / JCM 13448 / NCTC 12043 / ES 2772) TaxID=908937 RepID=F9D356_PREDD|nr:hypothetical protein HMPREF9136_1284 [Prevotella dentalis DSM 3688]